MCFGMAVAVAAAHVDSWVAPVIASWLAKFRGDFGGNSECWECTDEQGGEKVGELHGVLFVVWLFSQSGRFSFQWRDGDTV